MKTSALTFFLILIFFACKEESPEEPPSNPSGWTPGSGQSWTPDTSKSDCLVFWEDTLISDTWVAHNVTGPTFGCSSYPCNYFKLNVNENHEYTLDYLFFNWNDSIFVDTIAGVETGFLKSKECENDTQAQSMPGHHNPDGIPGIIFGEIEIIPASLDTVVSYFRYERSVGFFYIEFPIDGTIHGEYYFQ